MYHPGGATCSDDGLLKWIMLIGGGKAPPLWDIASRMNRWPPSSWWVTDDGLISTASPVPHARNARPGDSRCSIDFDQVSCRSVTVAPMACGAGGRPAVERSGSSTQPARVPGEMVTISSEGVFLRNPGRGGFAACGIAAHARRDVCCAMAVPSCSCRSNSADVGEAAQVAVVQVGGEVGGVGGLVAIGCVVRVGPVGSDAAPIASRSAPRRR